MCRYLPGLPDGSTELFCHPATGPISGQHGYDNRGELAALCSPRVRRLVDSSGVRLVNFGTLH